jgi:hypothetical protein
MAPIVGISKALGYRLYRPTGGGWELYEARIATKVALRTHDLLVIHPDDAVELGVAR